MLPAPEGAPGPTLDRLLLLGLCVAVPISGYFLITGIGFASRDLREFVLPWFDYIVAHGRFAALGDSFANYTPPYLYLLSLVTNLDGLLSRTILIKLISIAFNFTAAAVIFDIARLFGRTTATSLLAALVFLMLPTIVLNSAVWGQSDIIYATFLLVFADAVLRRRPVLAMLGFSIAISIKLQAIFMVPFLVYLVLVRFFRLRHLAILPATYLALMLPAALAGRGWFDLATIYLHQAELYEQLSLAAPNPYLLLDAILPQPSIPAGGRIGLAAGALASLALLRAFWIRRNAPDPVLPLAMMTLTLAMMPFVLPHMHERYFFAADVFAFALMVQRPSTWPIAVLLQMGSALAYGQFLYGCPFAPYAGMIPMTAAIGLTLRLVRRAAPGPPIANAAVTV